ncbi:MAG: DUF559 domain-containing protein, partial [Nitrospirae bacterium]|nr:DUF559 domain-containing protein [Nitrospirota bacterium]
KDNIRDDYMTKAGLTILRFSDREVLQNINAVLEQIFNEL